ncbi:hypothetical protein ACSQ67_024374 [Phaseolus vulgaris]
MATSSPTFIAILLHMLLHLHSSAALPLSVGSPDEDVIVSRPKGTFTAGFRRVGENAYCFGVWFSQAEKHVVWMANRDVPVNGKRSSLSLLKNGNLVLSDAGQFDVWDTKTLSAKPLELHLHDTGNLVLREQTNRSSVLWQSFNFPTDTLLPGQILTRFTTLVSSRSEGNYSSGFYKLFFDNDNIFRLLYEGPQVSSVYWPDPWLVSNNVGFGNGRSSYNSSRVAVLDELGKFSASDAFSYKTIDYGLLLQRRLTLDYDGNVRIYSRENGQEDWSITGQFKSQPCFIHGICGPYSICNHEQATGRKCVCLEGYSWIDSQDWSLGCKPNFQPTCDNKTEYRFVALYEVDFYGYDYGSSFSNYTYKQCEKWCSELCQCKGFQFSFAQDNGLFWCYPKTQLLNGHRSPGFPGQFFLRLPKGSAKENNLQNNDGLVCPRNAEKVLERPYVKGKENGSVKFVLWFAVGLGGFEVVCIFMVWYFLFRSSNHLVREDQQGYVLAAAAGCRRYTYSELKQATKGFSEEIGRGAGGTVYKGMLSDNRIAAIKKLHEFADQGESVQDTEPGAESHERLATWVREKRRKAPEGASWVEQIVDPTLGSDYNVKQLEILAKVALDCVEEEKDVRPSMSQVVERLQSHEHGS